MSSNEKLKILITDSLSEDGLKIIEAEGLEYKMDAALDGEALKKEIVGYDALIIRSGTTVTEDIISAADKLKVIGRAGVGVDNIDSKAATRKGIVVMNTPGGNTISACEHTWALILSVMRNVPQAHASLSEGKWDKKNNKGQELYGKTIGVVGLGKIGYEVAVRAKAFGMKINVFDPYVSKEMVEELGANLVDLDIIYKESDVITIHVPKNEKTKNLINKEVFPKMKKTAVLINCARGGIVNESDLAEAVQSGVIKSAAVDVYDKEPTTDSPVLKVPAIINTPHLGAATVEAQERVAVEIVKQSVDYLKNGTIINSVNLSGLDVDSETAELAQKLGSVAGQMTDKLTKKIVISFQEDLSRGKENILTRFIMSSYLSQFNEGVNLVNAEVLSEEKGVEIVRQIVTSLPGPGQLEIKLEGELSVTGALNNGSPRLTGVDGYNIDIPLQGNLIIIHNNDIPGVIGHIGTVLGTCGINIAYMEVGRSVQGGSAVTVIDVDQPITEDIIKQLELKDCIISVKSVTII